MTDSSDPGQRPPPPPPGRPAGRGHRLARYYRWLTGYQVLAARLGHDAGQRTFTVHRRLRDAAGARSGDVLHERLAAALDAAGVARGPACHVIDAGCGLGGTAFFLEARRGGRYDGLTLGDTQAARATAEAARRGCGDACRFHVRDFDAPLDDLAPDGVHLVVAIESLAHAPDPAATLAHLAARLAPDGALAVVDDMPDPTLPPDDVDLDGFRRGWHVPAVLSPPGFDAALASAGLVAVVDDDLTALVPQRPRAAWAALYALARAAAPLAVRTPARVLHDALIGGLHLERLYARGRVRYRLVVARRVEGRAVHGAQASGVTAAIRQRTDVAV